MLTALTMGLALWIVYGVLRGDWVIISANAIGATLAAIVLRCKLRDRSNSDASSKARSSSADVV
jgi:MtN3 and saliva related transmembrane protein